jgi:hypothetical protein
MMRQLSCKDLDSAYREVSKIANSMLMRSDAPIGFTVTLTAVFVDTQSGTRFHGPSFLAEKEGYTRPQLKYVTPVLILELIHRSVLICHVLLTRYESHIETLNEKISHEDGSCQKF